ncbi:23S rRNA (adenine(2030)-N(6))-methyltransferase RlmJ [Hydrogenovibrio sp. 3SP14C1]|uniref:23S rRNA (adenine(2030)-N(6))-methyltransferase RlmJ n=1 Tax=Hydrogenovibrio sp. 3SP14C1 TaxID=3038774 RepID=UPI00241692CC|nr:23S rRNA (adenine(2030)-N(6))-methyltransferase RlmJ [Hydrogenovibrio sp. 3SP14C1]MDG4812517.1 23S rRNA (adenine(2030)-N(6))-methyltransferase RlmJ [Hydrogenovibrio sp. 3SP14C1]
MLSYLHSFHAGNFADVLKHSVSIQILTYLIQKPKPLYYLDTHSGTGAFALDKTEAQKNKEYENGIGKLWSLDPNAQNLPGLVTDYLALAHRFNPKNTLTLYPGSPWFAQQILREQDRLGLFELHPREHTTLRQNFAGDRRIHAFQEDGFHGCISQLPPKEKRGYVLMDPPYEVKKDYQTAIASLIKAHKKFSNCTYALWYPMVDRYRINAMEKTFKDSDIRNIQLFELGIKKDSDKGMTASGMIIINPPWTLMKTMQEGLPFLSALLAGENGHFRAEQLIPE